MATRRQTRSRASPRSEAGYSAPTATGRSSSVGTAGSSLSFLQSRGNSCYTSLIRHANAYQGRQGFHGKRGGTCRLGSHPPGSRQDHFYRSPRPERSGSAGLYPKRQRALRASRQASSGVGDSRGRHGHGAAGGPGELEPAERRGGSSGQGLGRRERGGGGDRKSAGE